MAKCVDLKATYELGQTLGAGSFGKIFLATDKKDPDMKVAIKVINKKILDVDVIKNVHNEIKLMQ
jgi:serine/threonine protein kinase